VPAEQGVCTGESRAECGRAPSLRGAGWDGARVTMVRPWRWPWWWLWGSVCSPSRHWCCGVESAPSRSAGFPAAPPRSLAGISGQRWLCHRDNPWPDNPGGPMAATLAAVRRRGSSTRWVPARCCVCQGHGAAAGKGEEAMLVPLGLRGRGRGVRPRAGCWRGEMASAGGNRLEGWR